MALYVAVMFAFALRRFHASSGGDEDYAVFDQSMWTSLHGLPMWNSVEGGSHFGYHVSPVFWLFLPLYALAPGVPLLLFVQTACLAAAAWPLYLIARPRLGEPAAAWVAALYLFYHPVHGINYDQLNELAFAPLALTTCLYGLLERRWPAYWAGLALTLLVKEDMALIAAGLGLYAMATGERRRGAVTLVVALAWLWLAIGVVRPHFRTPGGDLVVQRFSAWGGSFPQIVWTMATHPLRVLGAMLIPNRFQYVPELLAPWAFVPLLSPGLVAVGAPTWVANLLSSFGSQSNGTTRYSGALVPLLAVAFVLGVSRMAAPARRRALGAATFFTLGFSLFATPVPPRVGFHLPPIDEHQRHVLRVAAGLPTDVSLSTQAGFLVHACHRRDLYLGFHPGVAMVVRDASRPDAYAAARWDASQLAGYRLILEDDGIRVYRKP